MAEHSFSRSWATSNNLVYSTCFLIFYTRLLKIRVLFVYKATQSYKTKTRLARPRPRSRPVFVGLRPVLSQDRGLKPHHCQQHEAGCGRDDVTWSLHWLTTQLHTAIRTVECIFGVVTGVDRHDDHSLTTTRCHLHVTHVETLTTVHGPRSARVLYSSAATRHDSTAGNWPLHCTLDDCVA